MKQDKLSHETNSIEKELQIIQLNENLEKFKKQSYVTFCTIKKKFNFSIKIFVKHYFTNNNNFMKNHLNFY